MLYLALVTLGCIIAAFILGPFLLRWDEATFTLVVATLNMILLTSKKDK